MAMGRGREGEGVMGKRRRREDRKRRELNLLWGHRCRLLWKKWTVLW